MRNLFLTIAAVAAFAAPVAASAQTEAVSFSIENNSDKTIVSILYGQSSSDDWSDDILEGIIEPGDTVHVEVDDDLEDCMYDFFYSFDDDTHYVERVDMCEINGDTFEFTGG